MPKDTFQLSGNAADIYETQKVPAMFGPLADAMLGSVELNSSDRILDVACGTGIVARKAKEKAGKDVRVVGADLNKGMIDTAQSLIDPVSQSCEWVVAPADNMPFANGEFTKVFCQQGLQFFPDQKLALIEMRRVLAEGGQIFVTIWKEPSPFFSTLATAIENHVNQDLAAKSLAPFTYKGHGEMPKLLKNNGFSGFRSTDLTIDRKIRDPKNSIEQEILGNPVGKEILEIGEEVLRKISEEVFGAMEDYIIGNNLVVPQTTCLYQAAVR